jgi:hypothetical protein
MIDPRTAGWRIYAEGTSFAAVAHGPDGEALYSVRGWSSERACAQFLALYLVLLISSKQDDARQLLQSFMQRDTPGKPS